MACRKGWCNYTATVGFEKGIDCDFEHVLSITPLNRSVYFIEKPSVKIVFHIF